MKVRRQSLIVIERHGLPLYMCCSIAPLVISTSVVRSHDEAILLK